MADEHTDSSSSILMMLPRQGVTPKLRALQYISYCILMMLPCIRTIIAVTQTMTAPLLVGNMLHGECEVLRYEYYVFPGLSGKLSTPLSTLRVHQCYMFVGDFEYPGHFLDQAKLNVNLKLLFLRFSEIFDCLLTNSERGFGHFQIQIFPVLLSGNMPWGEIL